MNKLIKILIAIILACIAFFMIAYVFVCLFLFYANTH